MFALLIPAMSIVAQNNITTIRLVKQDTVLLNAVDCNWIISTFSTNQTAPVSAKGKSAPQLILEAVKNGKLKAFDPQSNSPIPASEIFKWKMGKDMVAEYDDAGGVKYHAVQQLHKSKNITRIRIIQNWYFDLTTKKLNSTIQWIELLEEIYTATGNMIGFAPLCKIYY
jgi:hypothetical protein